MRQHKLEATQRFGEGESMFIEKIITLSLKLGMLFLLEDKHNITGDTVRLQTHKQLVSTQGKGQTYWANILNQITIKLAKKYMQNILLHLLLQGR